MTREEILEKSRKENKKGDEMGKKILRDAMKYSYLAMILAAALFAWVRLERGDPVSDLPAICCFSVFANFLYRFIKTKEKSDLFVAVLLLAAAIAATIRFFLGH